MGTPYAAKWGDIRARLESDDLWTADTREKLSLMFDLYFEACARKARRERDEREAEQRRQNVGRGA